MHASKYFKQLNTCHPDILQKYTAIEIQNLISTKPPFIKARLSRQHMWASSKIRRTCGWSSCLSTANSSRTCPANTARNRHKCLYPPARPAAHPAAHPPTQPPTHSPTHHPPTQPATHPPTHEAHSYVCTMFFAASGATLHRRLSGEGKRQGPVHKTSGRLLARTELSRVPVLASLPPPICGD